MAPCPVGVLALFLLVLIQIIPAKTTERLATVQVNSSAAGSLNEGVPKKCVILYYTDFYRWKWLGNKVHSDGFFSPSRERSCIITSNRTYLPNIEDYDALIFFQWNVKNNTVFPDQEKRLSDQLYIMHYLESPQRSLPRSQINPHSHLFNLTMSYRLDSDIVGPYGRIYDTETGFQVAPSNSANIWRKADKDFKADNATRANVSAKKKLISWVVSNCKNDPSERMELALSLKKHVQVDIYGKCGMPCPGNCKGQLSHDYFFYLAFENSLAVDYVSEKPYEVLGRGAIPIVFGGADYAKFLPPKSYINAQDFNTTKELSAFLTNLSQDTEEYLSYFWWQRHYHVRTGQGYVDLCSRLKAVRRQLHMKTQHYLDLELWEQKDTWINRTIQFV